MHIGEQNIYIHLHNFFYYYLGSSGHLPLNYYAFSWAACQNLKWKGIWKRKRLPTSKACHVRSTNNVTIYWMHSETIASHGLPLQNSEVGNDAFHRFSSSRHRSPKASKCAREGREGGRCERVQNMVKCFSSVVIKSPSGCQGAMHGCPESLQSGPFHLVPGLCQVVCRHKTDNAKCNEMLLRGLSE